MATRGSRRHSPVVSINFGGGRKRRRGRRRRAKVGLAVAIWGFLAALFGLAGFLLDLTTLILVGVTLGVIAIIVGIVGLFGRPGGPGAPNPAPGGANPRNPGGSSSGGRRQPVTGTKAKRCGAACQKSRQPVDTCDCSCGGRNHGRLAGTVAQPRPARDNTAPRRRPTRRPAGRPRVNTRKAP